MALTKAQIAERLSDKLYLHTNDAKKLVDAVFEHIRSGLEQGHHVKISGFGNFCLRDKKERPGRNPKTGEPIPVSARRVVTFHAGQKLRARVEQYRGGEESAGENISSF